MLPSFLLGQEVILILQFGIPEYVQCYSDGHVLGTRWAQKTKMWFPPNQDSQEKAKWMLVFSKILLHAGGL